MEVKSISIKSDLTDIPNIENGWCDVFVTLDDDRTYIVQVLTYQNFLESEDEETINFLSPIAPSIIVKELTKETIEAAIQYYAKERDGYWLKFCHMGTEIDDKTLNLLTDRWFARTQWSNELFEYDTPENPDEYSLIDFTLTKDSNLKVEAESLASLKLKAKLKAELKEELKEELRMELKNKKESET
jgi:hypothetical protein